MANIKLAIGIPTLNRWDLLEPALMFYIRHDFPEAKIYIVDNGNQDIPWVSPNVEVIKTETNIGVAASWNLLCNTIFERHNYAMILNDDIYLGRRQWEIETLLRDFKADLYVGAHGWCSFILPAETYKKVGQFDENFFPAYYEDNDYLYRCRLQKMFIMDGLPFISPLIFKNNQTAEANPEIYKAAETNKQYYVEKWGGLPREEKFKIAFNNRKKIN